MRFTNIAVAALSAGSAMGAAIKPVDTRQTNIAVLNDALELVDGIGATVVDQVADISAYNILQPITYTDSKHAELTRGYYSLAPGLRRHRRGHPPG